MLYNNLPTIDLHGETRETARILTNEFIRDNHKLGKDEILIIHGIGTGALKNEVHNTLKNNKFVEKYYIDNFNIGCTIVKLLYTIDKIDKK